jgi:hypothetical protein
MQLGGNGSPAVRAAEFLVLVPQPPVDAASLDPREVSPQVYAFVKVLLVELLKDLAGVRKIIWALDAKPKSLRVLALNDLAIVPPALSSQNLAAITPNLFLRNLEEVC